MEKTCAVHGHILKQNEEKVLIYELTNGECTHPVYKYPIEEGGCCSWNRMDIREGTVHVLVYMYVSNCVVTLMYM